MKVDGGVALELHDAAASARELEAGGYDGAWTAETTHDPFLPLALAAEHTTRLELGTAIAVAFARNPMLLANIGYDLQQYSHGRFILGLGSQVKAHVTKRFSMEWSHPARRMRELILAVKHIWTAWDEGTGLDFRGDFYTHTLMTPFFNPGPNPYGRARVFLAAVGERMTEVAGEVADGLLCHAFTTEQYLRSVTLPTYERGLATSGRTLDDVDVSLPVFVVTGADEGEMARADAAVRKQIAFYGSTDAYRPVLELHGWGELQVELHRLSKEGRWDDMGAVVDDEVLDAFAVVAEPGDVPARLLARFGDVVDRVSFYSPALVDRLRWAEVVEGIRSGSCAAPAPHDEEHRG